MTNNLQTRVYSPKEYQEQRPKLDGIVVYDGDGDGASATALWLGQNLGSYLAITNTRKDKRNLVEEIFNLGLKPSRDTKVGIFDISAEQNLADLERLAKLGAHVEFYDHHTKITPPKGIINNSKPDSRENSTSMITYNCLREKYPTLEDDIIRKMAHLAVLGMANDGKTSGAERLGLPFTSKIEINQLGYIGKVLNYAASMGNTIDFVNLLKELLEVKDLIPYLYKNPEINRVARDMESSLQDLKARIKKIQLPGQTIYVFPRETEKDRILSQGAYPTILDEEAKADITREYVGLIQTTDEKYRISVRGAQALKLAEKISQGYEAKAVGRETAAGFDSKREIKESDLVARLGE